MIAFCLFGCLRGAVKIVLRFILRRDNCHLILQNNDDMKMLIKYDITDRDHITLIRGSGVDIDVYKPAPRTETIPTVMLVARMLADKGVHEFIAAASELRRQNIKARFVLVGDTDPENPSAIPDQTLRQWHSEGVIEWWGRHENMISLYQQAHMVVLPSYREGLPKVLLEAAACGLPIVASDVPGCREIVIDGVNGLLVPVKDANSLSKAIKLLINNPDMRRSMGEKGRTLVEQQFSSGKIINQTLDLYKCLLAVS
jgi:Glycosyltransferase